MNKILSYLLFKQVILSSITLIIVFSLTQTCDAQLTPISKEDKEWWQENAKKVAVGTNLGLSFGNGWQINVGPFATYSVTPRIALGGGITYWHASQDYTSNTKIKTTSWGPKAIGQFYIFEELYVHVEGVQFYNSAKIKNPSGATNEVLDSDETALFLGGGYSLSPTDNISLRAELLIDVLHDEFESFRQHPFEYRVSLYLKL